jgi:uncharacterized protein YjfI (DUF2170 family)
MTWTTPSLYTELARSELASNTTIELIDGAEPTLHIVLHEQGDLPVFLSVAGGQIMVSTTLWEVSEVKDRHAFNEAALKLNPVNALSNVGIVTLSPGRDAYVMFGELSASSPIDTIVEEIRMLAINTIEAAEAFAGQLKGAHA